MPQVDFEIAAADNPDYSEISYKQGILEKVSLLFEDGIGAVTVAVEEQLEDGVWMQQWVSPSGNTPTYYLPVRATTTHTGAAGTGETRIPLKSPLGWRLKVTGAVTGTVKAFVTLYQG
jgi:hypothetical protein